MVQYSFVKVRETEKSERVKINSSSVPDVDTILLNKWQNWLDLVARLANIPAALIMKLNEKTIEVFLKSNSLGNPYHKNEEVALGCGLYCENVIGTRQKLWIPDATTNPLWNINNPDLDLNMISYLGHPLYWPNGEIFGTVCILDNKANSFSNDMDDFLFNLKESIESDLELVVSKKTLSESEEKFRQLFNLSPQPIVLTDYTTGKILEYNNKFLELTGFKKRDLKNKTTLELNFLNRSLREKIISDIEKIGIASNFEVSLATTANKKLHFLLFATKIRLSGKDHVITSLLDITQITNNQAEIKKLFTAIENSASSIIITNPNGEIEYVNKYFSELTGYEISEVLGKKPNILKSGFHPDLYYQEVWNTLNKGKIWIGEFQNRKKNGEYYWESATLAPVTDEKNQIINLIAIKQDITELKNKTESLAQSEKQLRELNATKDRFFSIIAHDLMDPFNALFGFSEILIETLQNKEYNDSHEYAATIRQSAQRILNLFQNLLIWSRSQSGRIEYKLSDIKIIELVNETLSVLQPSIRNKAINIEINIENGLKAFIDYNLISTVVRNLVMNAIKFTGKGGVITITANISDDEMIMNISDTGTGIHESFIKEIFRLDTKKSARGTENEAGTGLGLIICKEFVEIHKGRIWVESEYGKGSTFSFAVPAGLA